MDRQQLLDQARRLRDEGKSIRAIAAELGVHRSSVHRALRAFDTGQRTDPDKTDPVRRPGAAFVGRQREMAVLTAALDDAVSGTGRTVVLAGDPGIGKTRTAQEIAALARRRNALVLWGRCHEGQGAPPYWPWIQIVQSLLQSGSPLCTVPQTLTPYFGR